MLNNQWRLAYLAETQSHYKHLQQGVMLRKFDFHLLYLELGDTKNSSYTGKLYEITTLQFLVTK